MGFDDFFEQSDKRWKHRHTVDYRYHDVNNPYQSSNNSDHHQKYRDNSELPQWGLLVEKLRNDKRLKWTIIVAITVMAVALTVVIIALMPFIVQLFNYAGKL
jgi:hypothetical protein